MTDLPGTGTAAGFRATRELLGLPVPWCARFFEVAERTVERWEKGAFQIPDAAARELAAIAEETEQVVEAMIDAIDAGEISPRLHTYRTNDNYCKHEPDTRYPATWHRAVCARVMVELPQVELQFVE
ncbi:DUF1870 family protein [Nocardia sp. NPDC049220]|uniref:Aca2/YdiL-like domain-containing protein n=1 Tax=Nocardia sp. NPDC049220 TaxID=3155273 RepID=UPI0033DC2E22